MKPYEMLRKLSVDTLVVSREGVFGFPRGQLCVQPPAGLLFLHWKSQAPEFRLTGERYSGVPYHVGAALDACSEVMEVTIRWAHGEAAQANGAPALAEAPWEQLRTHRADSIEAWCGSGDYVFTVSALNLYRIGR